MEKKSLLREGCAVVELRDGSSLCRRSVLHGSTQDSPGSPHPESRPRSMFAPLGVLAWSLRGPLAGRHALPVIAADSTSPQVREIRSACPRQHFSVRSETIGVLDRKASAVRSQVDSFTTFEGRSGATGRKSGDEDAAISRAQPRDAKPNRFLSRLLSHDTATTPTLC